MKKLWPHQKRFIDKNPDRALLLWEMGCGKSLAICEWIKKRSERKALVICPKAIKEKWKKDLNETKAKADVLTQDEVKKVDISAYRAIAIDESQNFASPLFTKARSQRATKIYNHIRTYPDTHILLASATPVRSSPWNAHTLACYLQILWPIKKFRDEFEYFTDLYGRYHYELKPDWRKRIRPYIESISDIVLLRDTAEVPEQKEEVIRIPWTAKQENELGEKYLDAASEWHERHRMEQGEAKLSVLKELLSGYRKVVVVCYYTSQIAEYAKEIGKERQVFVLQGVTKDQNAVIAAAQDADDCVFIIQASMGAGFDADSFSVMIFASQSFKFTDHIQCKGRILRRHNLHSNHYIYLLGGKCDESVHATIQAGHDFHPPSYLASTYGKERA